MSGLMRQHMSKISAIFQFTDTFLIFSGYWLAHWHVGNDWKPKDSLIILLTCTLFLIMAHKQELYRSWRISSLVEEIRNLCSAWLFTLLILVFLGFVFKQLDYYHHKVTIAWLIVTPIMISLWHIIARKLSHILRSQHYNSRNVAIVGYSEMGKRVASTVNNAHWMGLNFCGYFEDRCGRDNRYVRDECSKEYIKGNIDELLEKTKSGAIDMVYITLPLHAEERIRKIIDAFSDCTAGVYLAQNYESYSLLNGHWDMLGEVPVLSIHESPFNGVDEWTKRLEDILLCLPILLVIGLPCLIVAILIKLDSPGPIIFKQKRYGLNGKEFTIWKFRSMAHKTKEDDVPQAKNNDPRTTKLGRFLRKTSIDELPQFLNVLGGSMSIVGPRPHAVVHNTKYRKIVDSYMLRHTVKPGITGWAQINGFRGETETLDKMQKRVEYDLFYIQNWSVLFDFKIIALTIYVCLTKRDAY
ncbi:undecaprenyl-phosphate glucose phosphotransferase [Aliiglaciecola litoralis]|uniref:Undecaprenyl-phosphate glucose phosphotransferase n=1 Tax=Aliiglaciecola litoralis TaxID=582857 RepID=A0ABN1LJJ7_9ALTE